MSSVRGHTDNPFYGLVARFLNWVAHPLGFGLAKGAGFDFVFILARHAWPAAGRPLTHRGRRVHNPRQEGS